jgi:hypothetical protein
MIGSSSFRNIKMKNVVMNAMQRSLYAISCGLAVCFAVQLLDQPRAEASVTIACAYDRPCFNASYQSGNKVMFQFTGVTGWDFYNVRYKVVGGEKQVENRSGRFTFNNVKPNRVYTLSVQGCNSRTFRRSTCSPWVVQSVTTR